MPDIVSKLEHRKLQNMSDWPREYALRICQIGIVEDFARIVRDTLTDPSGCVKILSEPEFIRKAKKVNRFIWRNARISVRDQPCLQALTARVNKSDRILVQPVRVECVDHVERAA